MTPLLIKDYYSFHIMKTVAISCLILLCVPAVCQENALPNIIIILADDLGYADLDGYGASNGSPNLLSLQKQGMRFTSFYAQPQCSPSRAALMTGCYPQRVGIPWVVGPEGPDWTKDKSFVGLNPDEKTLPEMLKEKGYVTSAIGKWHLGHHKNHLPIHHGFDQYLGLPYSNDMWPPNGPYPPLPLVEGDSVIETNPDQSQLIKRYTSRATSFIKANKNKPFFLYFAHAMPHVPIFASDDFKNKSGKGLFSDVIREIDWSAGEIMKELKSTGVEGNTILIFTSDNGPWLVYGDHAGSAGKLREGKATTFEGGVRVPFIVRWPEKIKAGSVCNTPAALFDLLPTFAAITGATLPSNQIDGKSILPLFLGKVSPPRDVHYYFQINELQAVRKGKWKLHLPHGYEHVVEKGKGGERGKVESKQIELSLFNLDVDEEERNNVANENPGVVQELKELAVIFSNNLVAHARKPGVSN
ncbi:MAG: sulfatase [Chryseolinea sp.]